ncbi:MAG: molybdopterin synthase catalytic subunit [Verrucomicrobiales bacterium]
MPNANRISASPTPPDLALTDQALEADSPPKSPAHGACVQFLGIVRGLEDGRELRGIDYRAYAQMAEAMLEKMAHEGAREFGEHRLKLHHRVGFVPVAEPSVVIRVTTPHSQAAFDICRSYLHRLKTEIPIWKHLVYTDD